MQKKLVQYFQLALANATWPLTLLIFFSHQIVFDNLINLKMFTLDKKLEKLQVHMNCQILDVLLPLIIFCKDLIRGKVIKC